MSLASHVIAGTVLVAVAAIASAAEIIDRVLAVVGGQIITLSDARAAARFGLVPRQAEGDPLAGALQHLIDRRLMLVEIERYAPPEPADAAVDEAVVAIRQRFEDASAFETALAQTSMSSGDLRRFVRDTLRITGYQQQRFGTMVQPAEEELVRYYREHAGAFTADGSLRPFAAVREDVRARVIEQRRDALIDQWLEGLRRSGSVVVLYLPEG